MGHPQTLAVAYSYEHWPKESEGARWSCAFPLCYFAVVIFPKLLENLPHGEAPLGAEGSFYQGNNLHAASFVTPGPHQLPVGIVLCSCSAAPPCGPLLYYLTGL